MLITNPQHELARLGILLPGLTCRDISVETLGPAGLPFKIGKGTLGVDPIELQQVTPGHLMQGQQLQLPLGGHLQGPTVGHQGSCDVPLKSSHSQWKGDSLLVVSVSSNTDFLRAE